MLKHVCCKSCAFWVVISIFMLNSINLSLLNAQELNDYEEVADPAQDLDEIIATVAMDLVADDKAVLYLDEASQLAGDFSVFVNNDQYDLDEHNDASGVLSTSTAVSGGDLIVVFNPTSGECDEESLNAETGELICSTVGDDGTKIWYMIESEIIEHQDEEKLMLITTSLLEAEECEEGFESCDECPPEPAATDTPVPTPSTTVTPDQTITGQNVNTEVLANTAHSDTEELEVEREASTANFESDSSDFEESVEVSPSIIPSNAPAICNEGEEALWVSH